MTTVEIPDNLIEALEKRAKSKDFKDVGSYIQMILEEVVRRLNEKDKTNPLSREEEELIKARLRQMGYID